MIDLHVVTGAFGYSGKYIAKGLLRRGHAVATLTNSPNRPTDLAGQVQVAPLAFTEPGVLVESLRGARVLYNTYWVRFDHRDFTHDAAVHNTLILFDAARQAGVERIVHVSITHPSATSKLPYFAGKARLEEALEATGIPHSILRPAVLFGGEDILVNNIAWTLRHFPVFGVFGKGDYGIRPIHVADFADLAIAEGAEHGRRVVDAVGQESFAFRELVAGIANAIGCRRPIVSVPPALGLLVARIVGFFQRDVFLTREEIDGLMSGLLESQGPATGAVRLTEWAAKHRDTLGLRYASEMRRRRDRSVPYLAS
jgi:uncharacterized protein YbjT (DUF2867 family)